MTTDVFPPFSLVVPSMLFLKSLLHPHHEKWSPHDHTEYVKVVRDAPEPLTSFVIHLASASGRGSPLPEQPPAKAAGGSEARQVGRLRDGTAGAQGVPGPGQAPRPSRRPGRPSLPLWRRSGRKQKGTQVRFSSSRLDGVVFGGPGN